MAMAANRQAPVASAELPLWTVDSCQPRLLVLL
jgi:hypothetical protein